MKHHFDFSEIYKKYRRPILGYVAQRIGDDANTEDLVQEIFLKVFRFRSQYRSEHAFSTWLWTIARNTVIDAVRGRRHGSEVAGGGVPELEELACPRANAETLLLERSEKRLLFRFVRRLTRAQRRVLRMAVIDQLPYAEIARRLGLSLSAVKCLTYRSRLALTLQPGPA